MIASAGRVSTGALTVGKAILWAGLIAGALDAIDGIAAYSFLGLSPIQVLQFIASGALGKSAFSGGLATAALGAGLHFSIAFVAAALYVATTRHLPALNTRPVAHGTAYGLAVFVFMSYFVLPLSAVAASPFSLPMFLNGVFDHVLFVGIPIALVARKAAG